MNLLRKVLKISMILALVIGGAGCSSTLVENVTTQEEFIEIFEDVINDSLEEQQQMWNSFEKKSSYTKENYINDLKLVLQNNINTLNENKNVVKDDELLSSVNDYIDGLEKKLDALNATDKEIAHIYEEESNLLKKESLVSLVENYNIKIKDNNNKVYNEILKEVIYVYKENDTQDYANKLADEILFNKIRDDFGDITFAGVFENTSDLNFKKLGFKVEYKDKSGEIVYNDYISIKNFSPGIKKKIELRPYENRIVAVNLVTDWYEIK